MNTDDLEAKRKARMERFGTITEVQETQRNVTDKTGFKMNRRKAKMLKKRTGDGKRTIVVVEHRRDKGKKGDRSFSKGKGKMYKRFKKSN